jgi:hypothetical protein
MIVTIRGAGCDGRLWRETKRSQRTAKPCGPGAATVASIRACLCGPGNGGKQTPFTGESAV